jgi:hypothetical protein
MMFPCTSNHCTKVSKIIINITLWLIIGLIWPAVCIKLTNYNLSFIYSWWHWYSRVFFYKFIALYTVVLLMGYILQLNIRWLNWKKGLIIILLVNYNIVFMWKNVSRFAGFYCFFKKFYTEGVSLLSVLPSWPSEPFSDELLMLLMSLSIPSLLSLLDRPRDPFSSEEVRLLRAKMVWTTTSITSITHRRKVQTVTTEARKEERRLLCKTFLKNNKNQRSERHFFT